MNNPQNTTPRAGMRPWLKVVLALSLAMNLAVIGIGAGAAWRFHEGDHDKAGPPMLGRFIFKDIGGREVRRLVRDHGGETGNVRSRRRQEMEQIIVLLRAEELDVVAVSTILEAHIIETHGFMHRVAETWQQRLVGLSLKERHRLAERMQNQLDRGPHHSREEDRGRDD
ncbi:hypothetical protein [Phaeobacter sp. 11ANDIMAR09]|uniref:hypothetical protein n=1 Tax=Phaeobacter sp. 11ANDIMAR09 TaxID=1225647 RepID=UPI0006C8D611|nr:hypothetical protein [Phaeobacter sp. 11ANDIMAR09]